MSASPTSKPEVVARPPHQNKADSKFPALSFDINIKLLVERCFTAHATRHMASGIGNQLSIRHYADPVSPTRRNPPPIPADTSREAWLFERAMRARQTPAERLREFAAVVDVARTHQLNATRRRFPDLTEIEVRFVVLRAWYGDELVEAAWPDAPPKPPRAKAVRPQPLLPGRVFRRRNAR